LSASVSHPFRFSYGQVTIRYGGQGPPRVLWNDTSLFSAVQSHPIQEFMQEVCEALWTLSQTDIGAGYAAADAFFGSFTPTWNGLLQQRRVFDAVQLWVSVLTEVRDWEKQSNKTVHKGTPYYFLGATHIFGGDYDLGFRYVYDAIEEDKSSDSKTGHIGAYRNAPAYMLVSLVDSPKNFLYQPIVLPARRRIDQFLQQYRGSTSSTMKLTDFENKFLSSAVLEFQKLFFVYVLLEMIKRENAWDPAGIANDFTKMKNRDILFDLCLVIEEILKAKYSVGSISKGVYKLCSARRWLSSEDIDVGKLNENLSPMITGPTAPGPDVVVPALLDGTLTYRGNRVGKEMSWLILAWHLRNYAAHELTPQEVLVRRYKETAQALMNALFLSLE